MRRSSGRCAGMTPRQSRAEARAGASLAAFGVADQALPFRYLALIEDVFLVLVRVLAFLEHEAHRRADQLEALAEEVLEIRSEEHTSELQSLMRISYAVFCLKKKTNKS